MPAIPWRASSPRQLVHEVSAELESRLYELLSQHPPAPTIELAFRHKETVVRELFATLDARTARALHHRLALPRQHDALAELFGRFTVERRTRLLKFLEDTRRREAVGTARATCQTTTCR